MRWPLGADTSQRYQRPVERRIGLLLRPWKEEVDATGRYRVLWGDFANLAQALQKSRRYLDSSLNVRSVACASPTPPGTATVTGFKLSPSPANRLRGVAVSATVSRHNATALPYQERDWLQTLTSSFLSDTLDATSMFAVVSGRFAVPRTGDGERRSAEVPRW